jgi:hypothetical protein
VDPGDVADVRVKAVKDAPVFADPHQLPYADVTLLVDTHKLGAACVGALEKAGIKVAHVFGKDTRQERRLKLAFQMTDATVKVCTIHSFKGWETRSLVVAVTRATSAQNRTLIYVALSRLKHHVQGSFLTVVCAAPELEAYGKTWPEYSRLGAEATPRNADAVNEVAEFAF